MARELGVGASDRRETIDCLNWLHLIEVDRLSNDEVPRPADASWLSVGRTGDSEQRAFGLSEARLRASALGRIVSFKKPPSRFDTAQAAEAWIHSAVSDVVEAQRRLHGLMDKLVDIGPIASGWNQELASRWERFVLRLPDVVTAFAKDFNEALSPESRRALLELHRVLVELSSFNFAVPLAQHGEAVDWLKQLVDEWSLRVVVPRDVEIKRKGRGQWNKKRTNSWLTEQFLQRGDWTIEELVRLGGPSHGTIQKSTVWQKVMERRKIESPVRPRPHGFASETADDNEQD